jgi:hypothetical protein
MNFSLPNQIIIQNISIPVIALFIFFGILSWFFSIWYEGRRDGFDEERLLDMSSVIFGFSTLVVYLLYRYVGWLEIYRPYHVVLGFNKHLIFIFGAFFGGLAPLAYLCSYWKWSKYRLLDIYVSAVSQLGFLLSFGLYFIYKIPAVMPFIILSPLIYILILRLRGIQFISGVMFSIFLVLMIPYIAIFYRTSGYLFFCLALATISIINFYLRWRKNYAGATSFGRVYKTGKRKAIRKATGTD